MQTCSSFFGKGSAISAALEYNGLHLKGPPAMYDDFFYTTYFKIK